MTQHHHVQRVSCGRRNTGYSMAVFIDKEITVYPEWGTSGLSQAIPEPSGADSNQGRVPEPGGCVIRMQ